MTLIFIIIGILAGATLVMVVSYSKKEKEEETSVQDLNGKEITPGVRVRYSPKSKGTSKEEWIVLGTPMVAGMVEITPASEKEREKGMNVRSFAEPKDLEVVG